MTRKVFRGVVGTKRITKTLDPIEAGYVRDIRSQMDTITRNFDKVVRGLKQITPEILMNAMTPTFRKSLKYVPKDTLELMHSGYIETRMTPTGATIEIGYGRGGKPNYAVFVHEMTQNYHKSPTRAKYLQAALQEDATAIPRRILKGYREAFGG